MDITEAKAIYQKYNCSFFSIFREEGPKCVEYIETHVSQEERRKYAKTTKTDPSNKAEYEFTPEAAATLTLTKDETPLMINGVNAEPLVEPVDHYDLEADVLCKVFVTSEYQVWLVLGSTPTPSTDYYVRGTAVGGWPIAEANKLNSQEFLIANADLNLRDETSLLAVGEQVSIALINPVLSLTYDLTLVEDNTVYYSKETKYDYSKNTSYKEVTQKGVNGITRNTQKVHMVNGNIEKAVIINSVVIREPITEITTRGRKYNYVTSPEQGNYVDLSGDWKWPTNSPYIIYSPYGYRGGSIHEGIDITGTGYGSPIYAARAGYVTESYWQRTGGNVIILDHQNGYYTMYAHLSARLVEKGQYVTAGMRIGLMGCSGTMCTGTHLHFGAYNGRPYQGGKSFDPRKLYQ